MDSFEDVLAQCLTGIEAGKTTIEECLSHYPQYATELAPLLRTAWALRAAPTVQPSPAFEAGAQARLANLIAAHRDASAQRTAASPASSARPRWVRRLAGVAAAVVLASSLVVGTAFAAHNSLPDSPLYPIRQTVEQVQIAMTAGDARRVQVFVRLMDARANETAAMAKRGNAKGALAASQYYARLLQQAEVVTERLPANRPEGRQTLIYMQEHLLAQQMEFQRMLGTAPDRARPVITSSLQRNQQGLDRINARMQGR